MYLEITATNSGGVDLLAQHCAVHEDVVCVRGEAERSTREALDHVGGERGVRRPVRVHVFDALRLDLAGEACRHREHDERSQRGTAANGCCRAPPTTRGEIRRGAAPQPVPLRRPRRGAASAGAVRSRATNDCASGCTTASRSRTSANRSIDAPSASIASISRAMNVSVVLGKRETMYAMRMRFVSRTTDATAATQGECAYERTS